MLDPKFLDRFKNTAQEPAKKNTKGMAPGVIIRRNGTKFLLTEKSFSITPDIPGRDIFNTHFSKCLDLMYGVREKKSLKLAGGGIKTLHDASVSGPNKDEAKKILACLENGINEVRLTLSSRFSSSHKLFFLLLSYFTPEELLFVDIETKSLNFETSIIQIGAGYFTGGKFKVSQFTAMEDAAEYELLEEFKKLLPGKKAFVTFNGRSFDIPFIDGRMGYYGSYPETDIMETHNFDLLHFSRCAFKGSYESFRLKEIEKNILKKQRKEDIEGAEAEIYYSRYLETKNFRYLEPIIYHNYEDITSLAVLLNRLISEWA